jgi:hypothetical protein
MAIKVPYNLSNSALFRDNETGVAVRIYELYKHFKLRKNTFFILNLDLDRFKS